MAFLTHGGAHLGAAALTVVVVLASSDVVAVLNLERRQREILTRLQMCVSPVPVLCTWAAVVVMFCPHCEQRC